MADIPKELLTKWEAVDEYFNNHYIEKDTILEEALKESDAGGLPPHNVAPNQGKLLQMIAQIQGAKRILEIGTLGGYSTIWFGRALPKREGKEGKEGKEEREGKVITLEFNPAHAVVARKNIERAGLSDVIEVRVGPAVSSLQQLIEEGQAPFDLIFIDADKINNFAYFDYSLKLSKSGTVIIADNVVRNGVVIDPTSEDPSVKGVRRFTELVAKESRVTATSIQTVGSKGYDGFSLIRVI